MAGKKVSKAIIGNLRELETRLTLRRVRAKGHIYVELRKDGKDDKRLIYFCVICRSPCYGDSSLFDHLRGKFHRGRFEGAELTLFGPNPWPFNDGFFFFYDPADHHIAVSGPPNPESFLNFNINGHHGESSKNEVNSLIKLGSGGGRKNVEFEQRVVLAYDESMNGGRSKNDLVIKGVLWNQQIIDLGVRLVGLGKTGAKIDEAYGINDEMIAIWCEWLGKRDPGDEDVFMVPDHDFGIVVFPCDVDLGRNVPGVPSPTPPYNTSSEDEDDGDKNMKSFSDPEDISSTLNRRGGSYGASSVQDKCDLQIQHANSKSKKVSKRKIRRQKRLQRIAEQRVCEMCQNRLLPGKDVACLLNMKTGRLACSGSNKTGAFHIFHTSCLIHWILVCESEIWKNQLHGPEIMHEPIRSGTKRKANKVNERRKLSQQMSSVFCPQCNCTGMNTEPDKLEQRQLVGPSQLFEHKITIITKHQAWMEKPEILRNRSTGLRFVSNSEEPIQEKVSLQKLVPFYRVD